jgi:signal transduction histidine kinase
MVGRLSVGQLFALTGVTLVLVAIAGIVAGELALHNLSAARALSLSQTNPATTAAAALSTAMVDQETGVRGFIISGETQFLQPYFSGRRTEQQSLEELDRLTREPALANARGDVLEVRAQAEAWRMNYALPTVNLGRRSKSASLVSVQADAGKALFDALRHSLTRLEAALSISSARARAHVRHTVKVVEVVFAVFAALLLLGAIGLAFALRRGVSRPLAMLGRQVRMVSRGDFESPLHGRGPRDVMDLAADVDRMRLRIVRELEALRVANDSLDAQTRELERSNSELEQFAYVASHDLQEPLRKVASFTQLLQRRYGGQLDSRADEYIGFAVDGAKRMQTLINDLLAFSRVGRMREPEEVVNLGDALSQALVSLSTLIEEADATINAGELPSVKGEPALLALVFQNLVGNALKFRGEQRPVVSVRAHRQGENWLVSCSDNGIGIDAQYAERIFVIFQRLHPKEEYAGTGIGLAMCRKIVEYHGGQIWLDQTVTQGTTFNLTLPAIDERT